MQFLNNPASVLAAGGTYTDSRPTDPDFPYLTIQVSSDVAGQLEITEWEQTLGSDSTTNTIAIIPVRAGAPLAQFTVQLRQAFWQIRYTNGATAQTQFTLNYGTSVQSVESDQRIQVLILRELRAISMLLTNLKEPTGTQVNIPLGFDQVSPN